MSETRWQKPLAVANFVITTAQKQGVSLTNFKLQRVLFFLQGYYLDKYNQLLFDSTFTKGAFGPIEWTSYNEFKYYGPGKIKTTAKKAIVVDGDIHIKTIAIDPDFPAQRKADLQCFTSHLLKIDSLKLSDLTRNHRSWKDYYRKSKQNQASWLFEKYYTNEEIKDCFKFAELDIGSDRLASKPHKISQSSKRKQR